MNVIANIVFAKEAVRRGCVYCLYATSIGGGEALENHAVLCAFKQCPFRELDRYKSYEAYLKATNKEFVDMITRFFN